MHTRTRQQLKAVGIGGIVTLSGAALVILAAFLGFAALLAVAPFAGGDVIYMSRELLLEEIGLVGKSIAISIGLLAGIPVAWRLWPDGG